MRHLLTHLMLWFLLVTSMPIWAEAEVPLRLGILNYRPAVQVIEQWRPLAAYLEEALGRRVEVRLYSWQDLESALTENELDVVITNPGQAILLQHRSYLTAPLATLILQEGPHELAAFGGVIFSRADANKADPDLSELGNKRIAAVGVNSFGGYQMQNYELKKAGLPMLDKGKVLFTGMPQDRVVEAVLADKADIGFVRTGLLESMAREGKLDLEKIRIINRQSPSNLPYAVSTALYPEWAVSVARSFPNDISSKLSVALLSLPHGGPVALAAGLHGFSPPLEYDSVEKLLRESRMPPFDVAAEVTLDDLWKQYSRWIVALGLLTFLLLAAGAGMLLQNRRVQQALLTAEQEIIERKRAAEELHRANDLLSLAQRAVGAGFWSWDMVTNEFQWSASFYTLFGLDPDTDIAGFDTWRSRVHPDDLQNAEQNIADAIRNRTPLNNEYRIVLPSSEICWIKGYGSITYDSQGSPLSMSGICIDTTEIEQTREALRQSEVRATLALEGAGDGAWDCDLLGEKIIYSRRWKEMLGYAEDEIGNTSSEWISRTHPEDLPGVLEKQKRVMDGEMSEFALEFRMRCKDGHWIWILSRGKVIARDANNKPLRTVGTHSDITQRKQMELKLVETEAAAQQANIAKSSFLATMSHEIRTPMNGILGMAQMLLQPDLTKEDIRDYSRTILSSGNSLLSLLNDILDLSKIESGAVKLESIAIDPWQIVGETRMLFASGAEKKGLHLEARWNGPAGYGYQGDPYRLQQMLVNLVSNAIKFTSQGFIHIDGCEIERNEKTAMLEFTVSDTGVGIPSDKLPILFQRFTQVDSSTTRQYGGTGLGLAIVKNLAHLMDGEASVESQVGKGSRFRFSIRVGLRKTDIAHRPRQRSKKDDQPVALWAVPRMSGRVLVVEDDPVNRRVIQAMLGKLGLITTMAENGQQGLDAYMNGEQPDLILMDVQMPVMGGHEATEWIRQWEHEKGLPRLKIIALTAEAFETDKRRCLAAGMDDVLTKPIAINELTALLSRWLKSESLTPS